MTIVNSLIAKSRMRRALLYFFLICVSAVVVLAQQPPANPDLPSVERLRAHITYLASDKLEGRRTGSAGAKLGAEYIAREFGRLGLRRTNGVDLPGMSILEADSPRRYLQDFPYVSSVVLGTQNKVTFLRETGFEGVQSLRLAEDWMPVGISANGSVSGWMEFVGFGITASELNHNDYTGFKVSGSIALALAGTPDGDNPHGRFARYEDLRWKAIAARNAGAKALIVITRELNFADDRLSKLRYDNAGDAGLPVVVISRQSVGKLLGGNAISIMERFVSSGQEAKHQLLSGHFNISTDVVRREVPAFNVIGLLPGSDPKLKDEAIVIGAHYDHLGRGGEGSLAPREGDIHHGADDNASGVAGMLELARIFSAQAARPKRTIVFIAFSGEEEGLLGSNYYVNHPIVPLAQTVAMINMDMIGRLKDQKLIIGGVGTAAEWRAEIDAANLEQRNEVAGRVIPGRLVNLSTAVPAGSNTGSAISLDFPRFQLTLNEDGFGPSDHSSFYSKQVPVLFFWTGTHEDYHKPSDTAEKINYEGEARILSLVTRIVRDIDKNDKRPGYTVAKTDSTGRSMGFRVYLGTIPNYADSTNGLLLDGVRDDSPAAQAGLKAGDRIIKLAGREVKNVYDYTYALGEMKAGQEYEVEALRGAEKVSLKITPAARK
jgi:Zn-dependent M28 family amino/carboxypeptidase